MGVKSKLNTLCAAIYAKHALGEHSKKIGDFKEYISNIRHYSGNEEVDEDIKIALLEKCFSDIYSCLEKSIAEMNKVYSLTNKKIVDLKEEIEIIGEKQ